MPKQITQRDFLKMLLGSMGLLFFPAKVDNDKYENLKWYGGNSDSDSPRGWDYEGRGEEELRGYFKRELEFDFIGIDNYLDLLKASTERLNYLFSNAQIRHLETRKKKEDGTVYEIKNYVCPSFSRNGDVQIGITNIFEDGLRWIGGPVIESGDYRLVLQLPNRFSKLKKRIEMSRKSHPCGCSSIDDSYMEEELKEGKLTVSRVFKVPPPGDRKNIESLDEFIALNTYHGFVKIDMGEISSKSKLFSEKLFPYDSIVKKLIDRIPIILE